MNEDKKLPDAALEGVTGGDIADEMIAIHRLLDCQECANFKTDACPYRSDMNSYYYDVSKKCTPIRW